jgi:hypothetical protein
MSIDSNVNGTIAYFYFACYRTVFHLSRGRNVFNALILFAGEVAERLEFLAEFIFFPSPAACKLNILSNNCAGSDLSRDKVRCLHLVSRAGEVKNSKAKKNRPR